MRSALGFVALVSMLSWTGCSEEQDGSEGAREGLTGGSTQDISVAPSLPPGVRGSGQLFIGGSRNCTGTAVERNVVLTAAHCLCPLVDDQYPNINTYVFSSSAFTFVMPYRTATGAVASAVVAGANRPVEFWTTDNRCEENTRTRDQDVGGKDLALIYLSRPLTPTELSSPMPVYTGASLLYRISSPGPGDENPLAPPYEINGFANARFTSTWTVQSGHQYAVLTGSQPLHFNSSIHFFYFESYLNGTESYGQKGDSGGPITGTIDGRGPTEFGVMSLLLKYEDVWDGLAVGATPFEKTCYSPTWDNGWGNGTFLRAHLTDNDADGVDDALDNCPASRCPWNAARCANVDQADADGDGIGDVCDNCAPSFCTSRGWAVGVCKNPGQADWDRDGVGDQCDGCPQHSDPAQPDPDHDLVTTCDNCPSVANGYRACQRDSDCMNMLGDGAGPAMCTLGVGGALSTVYGRCDDGRACLTDAGCAAGTCKELGGYGRCLVQRDDRDLDGTGNACDSCPAVSNGRAQVDSNVEAQRATPAAALGDACDPVPVAAMRQRVFLAREGDTQFRRLATLRVANAFGNATSAPVAYAADVVVYACDCTDAAGQLLDESTCRQTVCNTALDRIDLARWRPASIASTTGTAPVVPGRPQRVTFSNRQTCDENVVYSDGAREGCRVGELRDVYWQYANDVAAGSVTSHGDDGDGPVTAAILWSQVVVDRSGDDGGRFADFASPRDEASAGGLRHSFAYVTTPSVSRVLIDARPTYEVERFDGIALFRADFRPGGIIPGDGVTDPLPYLIGPTVFVPSIGGGVLAVGPAGRVDVTRALSPQIRELLRRTDVSWVTPAEPSLRANDEGLMMAAVPRSWRRENGSPLLAYQRSGGLFSPESGHHGDDDGESSFELIDTSPGASSTGPVAGRLGALSPSSPYLPRDREGAVPVLSMRDRALYLVGGMADGASTGEVWRFDLDSHEWEVGFKADEVLTGDVPPVSVADVKAATYDAESGRLIVLDRVSLARGRGVYRLLSLDRNNGRATVLDSFRASAASARFELVLERPGVYTLVSQVAEARAFLAQRFAVTDAARLSWLARASGVGRTLRGLHVAQDGRVVQPTFRRGEIVMEPITFARCASRPDSL